MIKTFLIFGLSFGLNITAFSQAGSITFSAGKIDRTNSIVLLKGINIMGKGPFYLKDNSGSMTPIQESETGEAYALLSLKAGEIKTFKILTGTQAFPQIKVTDSKAEIKFFLKSKQIIGFQTGKRSLPVGIDSVYLRGGYIHPVFSPSGLQVSDDYPLNHKHHHGIWAAWTKTEFEGRHPDFWNMGDKTGTVILEEIKAIKNGPVFGSLKSRNAYIDKTPATGKKALTEDWEIKVYNIPQEGKSYRMFDVNLKQQCISGSALKLLEYSYGGIGFRGNRLWDGENNTIFLTSEGKGRSNGHGTRADWCYIGGIVNGTQTGIAILSHPKNFRSPQPMRIHPTEPFFCFSPPQAGDFEIKPTEVYTSNYRFIVFDGEPDTAFINSQFMDYSDPMKVTMKP